MKFLRVGLTIIITTCLWGVLLADVAYADQADPDDLPTMTANVYRNMLENGDQLYIFYSNVPYASAPDAPVTEAFLWRLLDTDNATVLGQTVGTAYNDDGYGYNVYSMYFAAADAPTWDQPYIVRLSGNPIIFDAPPIYDFTLSTVDFSTETVALFVRSNIANRILTIADDLDRRWGLSTSLISAQETGKVLSLPGEAFFRGAIFGVQALAPTAFQVIAGTITATERTWDTTYTDNISTQHSGTFIETAQTAGADMFSKDYDLTSIILLLVVLGGVWAGNLTISHNVWSGLIDVALVSILFSRLGIPAVLLSFLGLVGALSWVYISGKVWGVIR